MDMKPIVTLAAQHSLLDPLIKQQIKEYLESNGLQVYKVVMFWFEEFMVATMVFETYEDSRYTIERYRRHDIPLNKFYDLD